MTLSPRAHLAGNFLQLVVFLITASGFIIGASASSFSQTLPDGSPATCNWNDVRTFASRVNSSHLTIDENHLRLVVEEYRLASTSNEKSAATKQLAAYDSALRNIEGLSTDLDYCSWANSGHSGKPKWQLHVMAMEILVKYGDVLDLQRAIETLPCLPEPCLPLAPSSEWRLIQMSQHGYAVLEDPSAPASARNRMHDYLVADCVAKSTDTVDPRRICEMFIRQKVHDDEGTAPSSASASRSVKHKASTAGAPGAGADGRTQQSIQPSCKTPNREVSVIKAVAPDYPPSARDLSLGAVTVQIEVTVGPSGNLISASVYKSANNMELDEAALRAARQSTYSPKIEYCRPVAGIYVFTADFQPN